MRAKLAAVSGVIAGFLLLGAAAPPPGAQAAEGECLDRGAWYKTFAYVGRDREPRVCIVPDGVANMMVEAWGGVGGKMDPGVTQPDSLGGDGGYGRAIIYPKPGDFLVFAVGGAGGNNEGPANYGSGGGASWVLRLPAENPGLYCFDPQPPIECFSDPSQLVAVGGGGGGGGVCLYGHGGDGGAGQTNYGQGRGNPGRDGRSCPGGHGGSGGGLGTGGPANAPAGCNCDGQSGLFGSGGGFFGGWGGESGPKPLGMGTGGAPTREPSTFYGSDAYISGGGGGGYGGGAAGYGGGGGGGGGSYPLGPFGSWKWNDQGHGRIAFSWIEKPPGSCTVRGTPGDDELYGTPWGEATICGGGGDDTIHADEGADTVLGGPGDDVLLGGHGRDELRGGGGDDRLVGGPHDDILFGHGGADGLNGGSGSDSCFERGRQSKMPDC